MSDAGCPVPDTTAAPICGPARIPTIDEATLSWETFLPAISVLACERGRTCGNFATNPLVFFCNPGFARHQARRQGSEELAPFSRELARECYQAMLDARECFRADHIGRRCLAILNPEPPDWGAIGDACRLEEDCMPTASCTSGSCADTPPLPEAGARCDDSCADGLVCDRHCVAAERLLGETCSACMPCIQGARCEAGVCTAETRLIGCACASDDDCPYDVSECIEGVCAPRPFLGEPCSAARCFGSRCNSARVCAPQYEGAICGADIECERGLVCRDVAGTFIARCSVP